MQRIDVGPQKTVKTGLRILAGLLAFSFVLVAFRVAYVAHITNNDSPGSLVIIVVCLLMAISTVRLRLWAFQMAVVILTLGAVGSLVYAFHPWSEETRVSAEQRQLTSACLVGLCLLSIGMYRKYQSSLVKGKL